MLIEDSIEKELALDDETVCVVYVNESIKLKDLKAHTSKYPFIDKCIIVLVSKDYSICQSLTDY